MKNAILSFLLSLFFVLPLSAQDDPKSFSNWLKEKDDFRIEPYFMIQLWSTYTTNYSVYNEDSGQYDPVADRGNIMIRRGRFGVRGEPVDGLKFNLQAAYDLIGRDLFAGLTGGTNNASIPNFGIWDAFLQWRIRQNSEAFYLAGGYFRPQLGRESITSGWSVNSMEKSMSQFYLRRHLTGTGPGRAVGLNFGGLAKVREQLQLDYNLGVFTPQYISFSGNSLGGVFSPLYVGRVVVNIGEPEMTNYKIAYDINYYSDRRGLSVGLGGSWQNETDLFLSSSASSVDWLFNWDNFNFDGEWSVMWRDGRRAAGENGEIRTFTYRSQTGHLRAGYNLIINRRYFLEPTFMFMYFNGASDAVEQADALSVGAFSGRDHTFDAGINWYLNKKRLKVMLHYTWRRGDPGDAGDGATVNLYYFQSGVGAVQRGNWLGLGLNAIF